MTQSVKDQWHPFLSQSPPWPCWFNSCEGMASSVSSWCLCVAELKFPDTLEAHSMEQLVGPSFNPISDHAISAKSLLWTSGSTVSLHLSHFPVSAHQLQSFLVWLELGWGGERII